MKNRTIPRSAGTIKVKRMDLETSEIIIVSINEAIYSLSGYWKEETIVPLLLQNVTLFTPYAQYKIK